MFKYYSSYALVLGGVTHLICCGIPFVLSLTSLSTNIFYFESNVLNLDSLEIAENFLFCLTSTIFLMLISLEIYNKKIKCAKDEECCSEQQCDSTKKTIKFNIFFSSSLYLVNSYFYLSEIIL